MRVRNPFDADEWFEFPAGTPIEQAREQMATQLIDRARERRSQPGFLRGSRHRLAHARKPAVSVAPPAAPSPTG